MAGRNRAEVSGDGAAAELAQRLRALRDESRLTLRQLAEKSGYSVSTLSAAEAGRRAPTWDVLAAFVQTCGDDPARWRQLWEVANAAPDAPDAPDPAEVAPVDAQNTRSQRTLAIAIGAGAALAAAGVATGWALTGGGGSKPASAAVTPATSSTVKAAADNTDPYDDGCKADQKQLDYQPVFRADGSSFGTIELRYSRACQAGWGYLNAPNSHAWTIHIVTHRTPDGASVPWQFSGDTDPGSWSNVLSTRAGCVWVEAYVVDSHGEGPHARTACMKPGP